MESQKRQNARLSLAPDRRIVKELISEAMDEIRKIRGRLWASIWQEKIGEMRRRQGADRGSQS